MTPEEDLEKQIVQPHPSPSKHFPTLPIDQKPERKLIGLRHKSLWACYPTLCHFILVCPLR